MILMKSLKINEETFHKLVKKTKEKKSEIIKALGEPREIARDARKELGKSW